MAVYDFEILPMLKGALPTFTPDECMRLLKFTLCQFRQVVNPTYEIILEKASGLRADKLLRLKDNLDDDLKAQLEDLRNQRQFGELELNNELRNLPSYLSGQKFSSLKGAFTRQRALLLNSPSFEERNMSWLKEKRHLFMFIATGSISAKLLEEGLCVDVIIEENICSWENWRDNRQLIKIPLIADIRTSPATIAHFESIYWKASHHHYDLLYSAKTGVGSDISEESYKHSFIFECALQFACSEIFLTTDDHLPESLTDLKVYQLNRFATPQLNVKFCELNDISHLVTHETIFPVQVPVEFDVRVLRKVFSQLKSEITNDSSGSRVCQAIYVAAEYEAVLRSASGILIHEYLQDDAAILAKKKNDFIKLINDLQEFLGQCSCGVDYRTIIGQCYLKSEIFCDSDFELECLGQINSRLEEQLTEIFQNGSFDEKLELTVKSKSTLQVVQDEVRLAISGSEDEARMAIDEALGKRPNFNIIIIIGVLDGQVQRLCRELYPDKFIVTLEPNTAHLASVLRYLPLISIVGRESQWLGGTIEDLYDSYKKFIDQGDFYPLIVDADAQEQRVDLTVFKKLMLNKVFD
ncbi:MAG: hypothetical protein HRT88_02515 [Lentisphaeraceae bacterium]|nr:hypothetical protein [Lentisphaeraceae bacterium]